MNVRIILPERSEDQISNDLRKLTELLDRLGVADGSESGLGGSYGYGADYNSDVFLMHHYCWCEHDDCPWCASCTCPEEAFHYFIDGREVSYEEWDAFLEKEAGPWVPPSVDAAAHEEWSRKAHEANKRRSERHDPVCDFCTKGVGVEFGAEPGKPAPNFWHKPSNVKIWFYKWIGRDMQYNRAVTLDEWNEIFRQCCADVIAAAKSPAAKQVRAEKRQERAEHKAWLKMHDEAGHLCHRCWHGWPRNDGKVDCMRGWKHDSGVVVFPYDADMVTLEEWPTSCEMFVGDRRS